MASREITIFWDGRSPVRVDEEEFELICLFVEEADKDGKSLFALAEDLIAQGYEKTRARELVILARKEVRARAEGRSRIDYTS